MAASLEEHLAYRRSRRRSARNYAVVIAAGLTAGYYFGDAVVPPAIDAATRVVTHVAKFIPHPIHRPAL